MIDGPGLTSPFSVQAGLDRRTGCLRQARYTFLMGKPRFSHPWFPAQIAALAHRHGARLFVDGAQMAAHGRVDVQALGAVPVVLA